MDYRELNAQTKPLSFYMPTVEEMVDHIGSSEVISKLDLTKGFHQIPVEESDRDKTTFLCPSGNLDIRGCHLG